MPTQEISRDDWTSFFDSFSDRHQGWLISVEVLSAELGDQVEVHELPLEGISVELDKYGEDRLEIAAGRGPDAHVTKTIVGPRRVWLKQTEDGADEAVEIDGKTEHTLLHLSTAIREELVDGFLSF